MWNTVGSLFTRASGDFLRAWRSMAFTDLAYKLIAFALLMPATTWLLYACAPEHPTGLWRTSTSRCSFSRLLRESRRLILGGSLIVAITAVEAACLMAVGFGAMRRA